MRLSVAKGTSKGGINGWPKIYFYYRIYKEKLASLKKQLQQLNDGTHPELNRKLKKIEAQYKDRLRYAEAVKNYEVGVVTDRFFSRVFRFRPLWENFHSP